MLGTLSIHSEPLLIREATTVDMEQAWTRFTRDDIHHLFHEMQRAPDRNDLLALSGSICAVIDTSEEVIALLQVGFYTFGIWVCPSMRLRGVASAVVKRLLSRDPEEGWFVTGRTDNEAGKRLFASLNFSHWEFSAGMFECRYDPKGELGAMLHLLSELPKDSDKFGWHRISFGAQSASPTK